MKSQVYIQLLATQLFIGASSAWVFAWSRNENAPVVARQTGAVKNHIAARSPAPEPTVAPALKAPRKDARILKRALETCGFRDGDIRWPLECPSGSYCFYNAQVSMMDCCTESDIDDCTPVTSCLDRTDSSSWTGEGTILCNDRDYPACVTLEYGPGSYSGYSWIACGATRDDFGTAYWGVQNGPTVTLTHPRTVTVTPSPPPKPSTSTPDPVTSTSTSTNTPTPVPAEASNSVPIGPIVGGAVGGVAVIALIGFGIFFLFFRKRRQDNVQPQNIQPQPAVSQIPPPTQTPTPGPGPSSPDPYAAGLGGAAAAANAQDMKGYYQQQPNVNVAPYGFGGSPPMSPVPPYSTSPPPPPQNIGGTVSPVSMSTLTPSQQFGVPSGGSGSPQMGLGVVQQHQQQNLQPQMQQGQQQYYGQQPFQQPQQQQPQQGYYYSHGQAAELDVVRGDGEVRELP